MKTKLLVLITVWRRPEIFRVMAQNLKFPKWIDAKVLAVLSPNDRFYTENKNTCLKYGFEICETDNNPVGEKRNFGLRYGMRWAWDYYFKIDSDDILNPDYWDVLKPYLKDGCKFIGMNQYCAYDTETGESQIVLYKKVIGGGKVIHRDIVTRCFNKLGHLYPPMNNSGLDNSTQRNIYEVTKLEPVKIDTCYLLDIKSNDNINHYRGLKWLPCTPVDYNYILENFGDIKEQLKSESREASER